jgi:hypothetical protein
LQTTPESAAESIQEQLILEEFEAKHVPDSLPDIIQDIRGRCLRLLTAIRSSTPEKTAPDIREYAQMMDGLWESLPEVTRMSTGIGTL